MDTLNYVFYFQVNVMEKIIEAKGITFEYEDEEYGNVTTFSDIDLDIEKGSFTVIAGRNGSGKSTLAKLLNGLNRPTAGKITVFGMDTGDDEMEFEIRKKVGLVFQNPDNQLVANTVEEDVAFGPENLGLEPAESRRRVNNALEAVGMLEFIEEAPHNLSGGQKQRVAIAGILAMEPECIVLDEPTSMLDPRGRKEVMDALLSLNKDKGITIILITHFMDEAALADRLIVMNEGKIVADGSPKEVFSNPEKISSAGLELTYPAMLAVALKEKGISLEGSVIDEEDCVAAVARLFEGRRG